jgi:hypothetical protein
MFLAMGITGYQSEYVESIQGGHTDKGPPGTASEGFDSLVAVNPATRWMSLQNRRLVPLESVMFCMGWPKAHAKVALGFDYLPKEGVWVHTTS